MREYAYNALGPAETEDAIITINTEAGLRHINTKDILEGIENALERQPVPWYINRNVSLVEDLKLKERTMVVNDMVQIYGKARIENYSAGRAKRNSTYVNESLLAKKRNSDGGSIIAQEFFTKSLDELEQMDTWIEAFTVSAANSADPLLQMVSKKVREMSRRAINSVV
jgi:hypothetical protein